MHRFLAILLVLYAVAGTAEAKRQLCGECIGQSLVKDWPTTYRKYCDGACVEVVAQCHRDASMSFRKCRKLWRLLCRLWGPRVCIDPLPTPEIAQ